MRKLRFILALSIVAVTIGTWLIVRGSDPLSRIENANQVILYSIRGDAYRYTKNVKFDDELHGYPVLGKVQIKEATKRRAIADALKSAVNSASGEVYGCFWPRHAVRVVSKGRTVDYLICFECEWVYVYEGSSENKTHANKRSQPDFDKWLEEAGLTLAKDVPPDRP